jgi:hypothetical protein
MFPVVPRAAGDVIGLTPLTTIFWLLGSSWNKPPKADPTTATRPVTLLREELRLPAWSGVLVDNGDVVLQMLGICSLFGDEDD